MNKKYYQYIEIELKIADDKFSKFINIPYKGKEYYHYHIFLMIKEIKRE